MGVVVPCALVGAGTRSWSRAVFCVGCAGLAWFASVCWGYSTCQQMPEVAPCLPWYSLMSMQAVMARPVQKLVQGLAVALRGLVSGFSVTAGGPRSWLMRMCTWHASWILDGMLVLLVAPTGNSKSSSSSFVDGSAWLGRAPLVFVFGNR
jgi:hypothetical protein